MQVVTQLQQFGEFMSLLNTHKVVALDTETSGLDPLTCILYIISIGFRTGEIFVFDCLKLSSKEITYLVSLLEDKVILSHNSKFDIKVLKVQTGIMLKLVDDTQTTEVLITNGIGNIYPSLEDLAYNYLGAVLDKSIRETFYKNGILSSLTNEQYNYAGEDVAYLFGISDEQHYKIQRSKQDLVYSLEMNLIPVVADMELEGVILDQVEWLKLRDANIVELRDLVLDIKGDLLSKIKLEKFPTLYDFIVKFSLNPGKDSGIKFSIKTKRDTEMTKSITDKDVYTDFYWKLFNIGSPNQLKLILNYIGYDIKSTGEEVLSQFHDDLIEKILKTRALEKKISSFGENFIKVINPKTGRIHTNFMPVGAASGRFRSDAPNLQNIVSDERYRACFIAPEDYYFVSTDYSGEEYRLAGAVSHDEVIIQSYIDGYDMHVVTGSIMNNGIPLNQVTKEQRRLAKTFNFASLYRSTDYGLSYNLKLPLAEATRLLKLWWDRYATLSEFAKLIDEFIWKNRYSVTMLGRRRYFAKDEMFTDGKEFFKFKSKICREGFNHCVDYETTCLTKEGWKSGNDVKVGDEVLTKNVETGNLEWNIIEDITKNIQHTVEFSHKGMSAVTTDQHRWLVDTKGGRKSIFKTTETLSKNGDDRIHRTGNWVNNSNSDWSDNDLKILGLVLTDGSYKGKSTLYICQTKPKNLNIIDNLLFSESHKKRITPNTLQNIWSLHKSPLTVKIRNTFPDKTLTKDFIFSLSQSQAKILFDWMLLGDGSISKSETSFYAGSKLRAEMFQLLSYIVGFSSTVHFQKPRVSHPTYSKMNSPVSRGCYFVIVLRRDKVQVVKNQIKDGGVREVWCPTVKNGTFVVNRNGHIYITGNCIQGTGADIIKLAMCRIYYENPFGDALKIILQVHDELGFYIRKDIIEPAKAFIEKCMLEEEQKFLGRIPAAVESKIAEFWCH